MKKLLYKFLFFLIRLIFFFKDLSNRLIFFFKDLSKWIYYYSLHFIKKYKRELILILIIIAMVLYHLFAINKLQKNERNLIDAFRYGQLNEYQRQMQIPIYEAIR